jgi:asparagine synthase (glutamine-hydrolysing)
MSGIVGIVNLDGAPVDRPLLERMTGFMAFRGPDAQGIWVDGPVGFGHTMFRTTFEAENERQPCTLDGRVWITADARVDGREDLVRLLAGKGRDDLKNATDPELILHAYHAWGENCVEHLIGDFAFAIWDERRKGLFCARDHFGVKPLFYARVDDVLVLSNALDCIRLHPEVSDELNDQAIGDFLLFDFNQEPSTTSFKDISRLPAAHTLTWSDGRLEVRRYWTLPIDEEARYRRPGDYVERFRELLRTAVVDRLRTDRVGIFMSGGLDSSSLAVTAQQVLSQGERSFELRAHTVVYDRLIPDRERHYAGLVAQSLGIPIDYLIGDDYRLYERSDCPETRMPEPVHNPLLALHVDRFCQAATFGPIVLSGQGPDALFRFPMQPHLIAQFKQGHWSRVLSDAAHWFLAHGRLPRLDLRGRLRRIVGKDPYSSPYPSWLNPAFEARLKLRERWAAHEDDRPAAIHPVRSDAYRIVTDLFWSGLFESESVGVTRQPVEVRYPFFDLRVVRYLLSVPQIPWCVNKTLLRSAMRGTLPDVVRLRPKTPLAGEPVSALLRRGDRPAISLLERSPLFDDYVDSDSFLNQQFATPLYWTALRPYSLDRWLLSLPRPQFSFLKEASHAEFE